MNRTLALAGWVTLGVFAFSLVAVALGRPITGSLIAEDTYGDAAKSAYSVITRGLILQGIVFSIVGLVVALLAGWIDRSGGWSAAMAATKRGGVWVRGQLPTKAAPAPDAVAAGATGVSTAAAMTVEPGDVDTEAREDVSPGASVTGEPAGAMAGV